MEALIPEGLVRGKDADRTALSSDDGFRGSPAG